MTTRVEGKTRMPCERVCSADGWTCHFQSTERRSRLPESEVPTGMNKKSHQLSVDAALLVPKKTRRTRLPPTAYQAQLRLQLAHQQRQAKCQTQQRAKTTRQEGSV